jgi:hypothetical protein
VKPVVKEAGPAGVQVNVGVMLPGMGTPQIKVETVEAE